MGFCQVLPIGKGARPIARAFESRGVALKYPARSRSGLRVGDGMVVFAISEAQVRVGDWGCSCPLWLPSDAGPARGIDRASSLERLEHCRLAVHHGVAEGFLLDRRDQPCTGSEVLTLLVVKSGEGYWARWGSVARAQLCGRHARPVP